MKVVRIAHSLVTLVEYSSSEKRKRERICDQNESADGHDNVVAQIETALNLIDTNDFESQIGTFQHNSKQKLSKKSKIAAKLDDPVSTLVKMQQSSKLLSQNVINSSVDQYFYVPSIQKSTYLQECEEVFTARSANRQICNPLDDLSSLKSSTEDSCSLLFLQRKIDFGKVEEDEQYLGVRKETKETVSTSQNTKRDDKILDYGLYITTAEKVTPEQELLNIYSNSSHRKDSSQLLISEKEKSKRLIKGKVDEMVDESPQTVRFLDSNELIDYYEGIVKKSKRSPRPKTSRKYS